MTIPLNQNEIIKYLDKNGHNPIIQKESGQTYITKKINTQEVPIFFVIISGGTLLQAISYIPFNFKEDKKEDLARLLHMLNKEIDMPGFGMDESENLIFYRAVVPAFHKILDTELLETYLETSKIALETFMGAIGMIATGTSSLDELIAEFKRSEK